MKSLSYRKTLAVDIHSTSIESDPMVLLVTQAGRQLLRAVPIDTVITNMLAVQQGIPISGLYGSCHDIPIIGIEAGTHEKPSAFATAIQTYLSLLQVNIYL